MELHPDVDAFQIQLEDAYKHKRAGGVIRRARAWFKLAEKHPNNLGIARRRKEAYDVLQNKMTCVPFAAELPMQITRLGHKEGVDLGPPPTFVTLFIIRRVGHNNAVMTQMQMRFTEVCQKEKGDFR